MRLIFQKIRYMMAPLFGFMSLTHTFTWVLFILLIKCKKKDASIESKTSMKWKCDASPLSWKRPGLSDRCCSQCVLWTDSAPGYKKPFKPILSLQLLSLRLNSEPLSTEWGPRPGLGGKQSFSYSAELMPVWLNAPDTNSRGFWSLRHYSSQGLQGFPYCAALFLTSFSRGRDLVSSENDHGVSLVRALLTSSRRVAENARLFTSPGTLSVYLMANTSQIDS